MHLKVQEAVGAEGHNVSTFSPSCLWLDAAHDAEACWREGGSLEVQNQVKIYHHAFRTTKTKSQKCELKNFNYITGSSVVTKGWYEEVRFLNT